MKHRQKTKITVITVLGVTVVAIGLVALGVLGLRIGYPGNAPLSYRIKWLFTSKPYYTVERSFPNGTIVNIDPARRAYIDKQAEAAAKALSGVSPEDLQSVNSFVRQAHFQLNDLVASGHHRRFTDNSTWASSSKEYLWERRVKEYVSGKGEMNLVARALEAAEKVGSKDLKADLETFSRILQLAYEKKDVQLLILAHRIVHDLDYWVFGNETFESRDYWGATFTLEGKSNSVNRLLEGMPDYREIILPDDRQLEDTSQSLNDKKLIQVVVKRGNDVFSFDAPFQFSGFGIVSDIQRLLWVASRGGAGIEPETRQVEWEELDKVLETGAELRKPFCFVHLIYEPYQPMQGMNDTAHKDLIIYTDPGNANDAYLAVQNPDNQTRWSLYRLPDYAQWLKKEVDLLLRIYTGL